MDFALTYLVARAVYRVFDFFHHWYVDGSRFIFHSYGAQLRGMEETFAIRVTLLHFFEPLYKDYSIVGRILGVVFRTSRVVIGVMSYAVVTVIFAALIVAWISIPVVLFVLALGIF